MYSWQLVYLHWLAWLCWTVSNYHSRDAGQCVVLRMCATELCWRPVRRFKFYFWNISYDSCCGARLRQLCYYLALISNYFRFFHMNPSLTVPPWILLHLGGVLTHLNHLHCTKCNSAPIKVQCIPVIIMFYNHALLCVFKGLSDVGLLLMNEHDSYGI